MKKHPLEEGSLGQIYRHFLAPLVKFKPEEMSLNEWTALICDATARPIARFRVKTNFKMPGLFYQAPTVKVQGIGYREMKVGLIVYVRNDLRTQSTDIEVLAGPGRRQQVFALSDSQWGWVKLRLEEVPRPEKRSKKAGK